ncbi:MAG: NUDIX hydrolase [Pseudomonadota bacterium]
MIRDDAFSLLGSWDNPGPYRGAVLIPSDMTGRVLIQLRDHNEAAIYPGKWGLFGGGVETGEDLITAARREFEEGTGILVDHAALRPLARIIGEGTRAQLFAFEMQLDITPANIRLGEGAGFAFLGIEDLMRLDLVPASRVLLTHWAETQISRG